MNDRYLSYASPLADGLLDADTLKVSVLERDGRQALTYTRNFQWVVDTHDGIRLGRVVIR